MIVTTRKKSAAFTLIEILVALVILAIALTAAIKAINDNIRFASILQNKTVATWVADDMLARMQTRLMPPPTGGGSSSGNQQMLGNNWYWQASSEKAGTSNILKINIKVGINKNAKPAASIIGFIRGNQ